MKFVTDHCLTIRSSRARFAVSDRPVPLRAGRLNSGVRPLMENSGSPIDPSDAFDIVGIRNDGGIDAVIVCSGPLDNSSTTLRDLELKVRNYLREIASEDFVSQYGPSPVCIYVSCSHAVSTEADQLITDLALEAAQQRVLLHLGEPVA